MLFIELAKVKINWFLRTPFDELFSLVFRKRSDLSLGANSRERTFGDSVIGILLLLTGSSKEEYAQVIPLNFT